MSSTTIIACAACGKEGDSLKACTACHMVKYCNRDCQIAHRKQHKKECKKRAAEIYDEKLFKEVEPEECPICLLPLPFMNTEMNFQSCCGKLICKGCIYAIVKSEGKDLCPYCRKPPPSSDEEHIKQTKKLIGAGNPNAYHLLASNYDLAGANAGMRGDAEGIRQNFIKANELHLKAGELGCAAAYSSLGYNYDLGNGVEIDMTKAKHYYELAAMMGHVGARHNAGCMEGLVGNQYCAMKHFIIAARAGYDASLDMVKDGFMKKGVVTKDEYASTLRAYHERQKEMKSNARDEAVASGMFTTGDNLIEE